MYRCIIRSALGQNRLAHSQMQGTGGTDLAWNMRDGLSLSQQWANVGKQLASGWKRLCREPCHKIGVADRSGIYCKSVFKNGEPAPSSSSRYDPPRHPSMHLSRLYNTIII